MSYHGLQGTSQLFDCPASKSKDMPAGLSSKFLSSYPLSNPAFTKLSCGSESPIADECNQSAMPGVCFYAKTAQPRTDGSIPNYMGRPAEQSDWAKWRAWRPSLSEAAPGSPGSEEGLSDAAFYGGLAALGAVAALGVWYAVRRLRPWH